MSSDNLENNFNRIEISNNIISLEYQFLTASILLNSWVKWAKTFSSLISELPKNRYEARCELEKLATKDLIQLQENTEKFFSTYKQE